jgi:hypothetical protein
MVSRPFFPTMTRQPATLWTVRRSLNEPVRLIHLLTVAAEICHFAWISEVGLPRR